MAEVEHLDVLVIGGGVAGLVAAWECARAGRSVTLIEDADVTGGKLRAALGTPVDVGAEAFAIRTNAVAELIADAGLSLDIVDPHPVGATLLTVAADGQPARFALPKRTIIGLPADPFAADVVAIIGEAGADRAATEPSVEFVAADIPLFELASRRYGHVVAERLVDPLCRSVYSQPATEVTLARVHPTLAAAYTRLGSLTAAVAEVSANVPAGAAVRGVRGGMSSFAADLTRVARAAGVDVRTGVAATAVRDTVQTTAGVLAAQDVILAVGESAARSLLGIAPGDEGNVTVVTGIVRNSGLDAHPVGTGLIIAPEVATRAKALTHSSAKWPWLAETLGAGVHAVRISLRTSDTTPWTSADFAAEATALLGIDITPDDVSEVTTTVWPDAVVRPLDPALAAAASSHGVTLTGALAAGTGLAAVIPHARAAARLVCERNLRSAATPPAGENP